MAKFLTGNELNTELEKLFENAGEQIILISPYIKLHDRYISTLKTKLNNPEIDITVVFGKNEDDLSRSMKKEDFNFFKDFPNIEIRYEKRLHAKYYANESTAILTSMNLYNFSHDNNIEAGVMTKATILGNLANNFLSNVVGEDSFDGTAFRYFSRVIEQSDLLFKKIPEYESTMFGLSKKYKTSIIEVDKLTDFFADRQKYDNSSRQEKYEKKPVRVGHIVNEKYAEPKVETVISKTTATETHFLTTTALSKELGLLSTDLYHKLEKLNWVERKNDNWVPTHLGTNKGAQLKRGQYREYISWPKSIINDIKQHL